MGLFRGNGSVIPTYCNNTVMRIPPAETQAIDKKLMLETGRRLAENYLKAPPLMAGR
jgi:hypothetical protein